MNFLTGKDALLEKQLLEKPATIKIFSGEFEKANWMNVLKTYFDE